jgi:hypothetical protein
MTIPEHSTNLQDWGWILADPAQPATDLQALMEAAPGFDPVESVAQLQVFREAVNDCFAALTQKERYVIEAKTMEGLSYSKLGTRLGCSKSQAERDHKSALNSLAPLVRSHPTIQERHWTYMEPTNWDTAAADAVNYLRVLSVTTLPKPLDESIAEGKEILSNGWEDSGGALTEVLLTIGATALNAIGGDFITRTAIIDLLCERHSKYGAGNINEFREYGLLVRMSDKVARIKNGAGDFEDESTLDAWMDLVGYAAIAHMLSVSSFNLPLKAA